MQRKIPAVYMRGGTSRALFFHDRDLPPPGPHGETGARDRIFCAALGSPDPYERQLDGIGGGVTSLSKVAVIGPPTHPQADVDYTFGQVDVGAAVVGYRGNCGNISSAVGPFALDEGLVEASGDRAVVTIHNTNTRKLIRATFPVEVGRAAVDGDFAIDGVAGTGAMIELSFLEPGGASTGKLLPTGRSRDVIEVPQLGTVDCSIVDAANPVVFVRAGRLGLTGQERPADLAADPGLIAVLRGIRAAGAVAAGMIAEAAEATTLLRNLPLVALLAPAPARAPSGAPCIAVRMISSDQPHGASPLTGAMCTAVAAQIGRSLVAEIVGAPDPDGRLVLLHPGGSLSVAAVVEHRSDGPFAREGVVHRTARRLMDGQVYYR